MTRWWEPGSDVALLEPTGVPATEFANAVAALHRAGAAAILDAADTNPLIDDLSFVTAMARAREAFAPLLIDPVAKSLGADRGYAGLLLRDIFDDAEVGALRLFQTAVARGVPRRTAAERTARVFGVPGAELARYARYATDPKAPPALLADVADETLFTSIAARAETEHDTVDVAKAESRDTRRAAQADEPRQHGRYAQTAGESLDDWLNAALTAHREETTVGPAQVAEPPAVTQAPRGPRGPRGPRAPKAPAGLVPATAVGSALESAVGSALTGGSNVASATRRNNLLSQLADRTNTKAAVERYTGPAGKARDVPDLLEARPAGPITEKLDDTVGFALPYAEFNALFAGAKTNAAGDMPFRAGALRDYAGEPARYGPPDDAGDTPHDRSVAGLARTAKAALGDRQPYVHELTDTQLVLLTTGSLSDLRLKELKRDVIDKWARENGVPTREVQVANEIPHVFLYRDFHDLSRWVLVYLPPPAAGHGRPLPNIADVLLPRHVRGAHERATGHGEERFILDENQPLLRVVPRDEQGVRVADTVWWDTKLGVARTQISVAVGSERDIDDATRKRFGKAESRDRRRAAQAEEPRGDDGRYTSLADYLRTIGPPETTVVPAPERAAPRSPRAPRGPRGPRGVTASTASTTEPQLAGSGLSSGLTSSMTSSLGSTGLRPAVARLIAAANSHRETHFDSFDDYTLTTDREIVHKVGVRGRDTHDLDRSQIGWLMNRIHRPVEGRSHEAEILLRGDDDWKRLERTTPVRILEPTRVESDDDWQRLEQRLARLIYDDGHEAVIVQTHPSLENGRPVVTIGIEVSERRLPVQHAIRWESGDSDDPTLRLVPDGEAGGLSRETLRVLVEQLRRYDEHEASVNPVGATEDVFVNPRVLLWRVERPDTSR